MRAIGSPDDEAAELPETVALADPPAAVHALRHRRGDALRGDQQRRQAGAECLGGGRSGMAASAVNVPDGTARCADGAGRQLHCRACRTVTRRDARR